MDSFRSLSDEEINAGIRNVVRADNENLVLFLRYLIEVERRDLFLEEGATSVRDFCVRILGLSRGTSSKRMWVSRACAKFPVILDFLSLGKQTKTPTGRASQHGKLKNASDMGRRRPNKSPKAFLFIPSA